MGPFVFSKEKTNYLMRNTIIALIPILLFGIYRNGINSLLLIIIGALTSFVFESLFLLITKQKNMILKSYSFLPGLFVGMILPPNVPLYVVIIAALIGTFSKIVFGGTGKNWLNPALFGYLIVLLIFGSYFNEINTPLINANSNKIGTYEQLIQPFGDFNNFFFGIIPGSIWEISSFLSVLAFVFLSLTKTIKWRIPICYVGTVFLIIFIIARVSEIGIYYPLFHILSGGLLFASVFLATDPVTSAVTPFGQVLQGILLGILTVIFRFVFTDGIALSIILVNLVVCLLDKIGARARFNPIRWVGWLALSAFLIMATGMTIAAIF